MASKFYNKIKNAKIEREVEDVYNEGISLYFLKNENIGLMVKNVAD